MFCGHNCNYNICHYVLDRGLQPPGNVFYHKSLFIWIYSFIHFWAVCKCSVGTTVIIRSVIMCCTEVCGHLVMPFITIKSLHIDLLIHIFEWYADVLWAQLVHSFDQVVGRVLLCGQPDHSYSFNTSLIHFKLASFYLAPSSAQ